MQEQQTPTNLQGRHLRFTVVQEGTFLSIHSQTPNNNDNNKKKVPTFQHGNTTLWFDGYIIDMIQAVSERANFTYELRPPSGKGSDCTPPMTGDGNHDEEDRLYHSDYYTQYNCGANDVTEFSPETSTTTNDPPNEWATDIYAGMFYISPQRQLQNWFTMPFSPPTQGTLVMYGTATQLERIQDLVQAQQDGRIPQAACVLGSTAVYQLLETAFPDLKLRPFFGQAQADIFESMYNGSCPVHIYDSPIAAKFVLHQFEKNQCHDQNGQAIGLIGQPLSFGLTHYAWGVGRHQSMTVVQALSYWINVLTNCNPKDALGACPQGNLHSMYQAHGGGTGQECGHVNFPTTLTETTNMNIALVTSLVVGGVALLVGSLLVWHWIRLRHQEQRYKYRFVEQIARNIEIGPSPGLITPEKLAEEIQHIAQGKGVISKPDLLQWMSDVKLSFLSEGDLNALWDAMDVHRTGTVDPLEFILFLSACGPQFAQVYQQHQQLPKTERLKLAARRLTNLATVGEDGVRKIQHKLDRGYKQEFQPGDAAAPTTTPSSSSLSSCCNPPARRRHLATTARRAEEAAATFTGAVPSTLAAPPSSTTMAVSTTTNTFIHCSSLHDHGRLSL